MMITSMERRRAVSVLDRTESRPSCASGLITPACEQPDTRDQVAGECLSPVSSPLACSVGGGPVRFTTLPSRSHVIQYP
jgi:hypothetical protein